MGTLGDIATIVLVGGIGYLALTKVNWNNLSGGSNETVIKIEPTTTTIDLPDNTVITPDKPLTVADTSINQFEVTTDPEKQITKIKEELDVPVNSTTTIKEVNDLDNGQRILTKSETKNYDTTIDPKDYSVIDQSAKNIGEGLKSLGVLGSDWTYTGINLKFLGL